ncbi:helix-turn-helix transcriptional regulator [Helicobacter pylori]|nr:helix-turn-helix transcriptional regulator [Helicobacter pylori]
MRSNDDFTKFWHSNKTVKRKNWFKPRKIYYASVENGKRNVSLKNIKKIADGLGVSLETLFQNLK